MDNILRSQENKLFEDWLNKDKYNKNFAKDGAGFQFSQQSIKILFLAKETNKTSTNWDTREYLDNGVFYKDDQFSKNGRKEHSKNKPIGKTFNNVYRWTNYLLNPIDTYKQFEHVSSKPDIRIEIFSKISMMNLKKETGGATTDTRELSEAAKKDFNMIQKQLELYLCNEDLKIIFCCGKGVYKSLKKHNTFGEVSEKISLDEKHAIYVYNKKLIVINFYHPQPRGVNNKTLYDFLVTIKKSCNLSIRALEH